MAWGYRASSYANNGAGVLIASTGGTTTVTLGAALSTGDLIVLGIMGLNTTSGNAAPTFAVSDSVNGSWGSGEVKTGTFNVDGNVNARYSLWAFPNSASGTPVITITVSWTGGGTGVNFGTDCAGFSGIATTSATDTSAGASGTGASPSSGAVSPATGAANELMVGLYLDGGENTTLSVGNISGSTATLAGKHDADGGKWQGLFEYGDAGSSGGTPSATATSTTPNTGWGMLAAVFKLSGGTPATVTSVGLPTLEAPGVQSVMLMQTLNPASDVSTGSWVTETGATTNLYQSIGEVTASDVDYVQSPTAPANAELKVRMATASIPGSTKGHHVDWRYRKNLALGQPENLTITLYRADGTTVVSTQTVALDDTGTTVAGTLFVTPTEAATIPSGDFASGLVLGFKANQL
jgi:hypothetical protein